MTQNNLGLQDASDLREDRVRGKIAYPDWEEDRPSPVPDEKDLDRAVTHDGENTFIGFGINVIDGADFVDAVRAPVLADEVYGSADSPSIIDSSSVFNGEYILSVKKELSDVFTSLNVSCGVETGKAVPFFSGGVSAMYGDKREVKQEAQFFRLMYSIITKKHTLKASCLFADKLATKVQPDVLRKLKDEKISPDEIFQRLGTHLILSHSLGGTLNVTGIYNSNEAVSSHDIEVAIKAASDFVSAHAGTKLSSSDKKIGSQTEIRIKASGGNASALGGAEFETLNSTIKAWAASVDVPKNQTLSSIYQYMPLWDLLRASEDGNSGERRRRQLEQRFYELAESRKGFLSSYFTRAVFSPDPKPDGIVPGASYFFRNKHADYYMDVCGQQHHNQPMQLYSFNGSPAQQFVLLGENDNKEFFVIKSVPTGKVLDVYEAKAVENNPVWHYERNGSNAQYFKLKKNEDGTVSFLSKLDQNLAIGTGPCLHGDGTKLILERVGNVNTQKWYPEPCK